MHKLYIPDTVAYSIEINAYNKKEAFERIVRLAHKALPALQRIVVPLGLYYEYQTFETAVKFCFGKDSLEVLYQCSCWY